MNRLKPCEFAVSFNNQLVMLQAGTKEDAHEWVVAIASCMYFLSPQFEELIGDCVRFFNAVPSVFVYLISTTAGGTLCLAVVSI